MAVPDKSKIPFTVGIPVNVFAAEPDSVKLLNVVAVFKVWAAPPKFTVLVPAVKLVPVPVQAVPVRLALMVLEPPFNVPAVSVIAPVKVCVKPVPKFSVPPVPLIVSAAALKLFCNVAVPAVLVMVILPVVVKPAMLWVVVPVKIMLDVDPVKVPRVTVIFPVKVWVNPAPKLKVPPLPFNTKSLALKLLESVAVPAVLVMLIFPVVVIPTMVCEAVPAIVMFADEPVNVPAVLVISPVNVWVNPLPKLSVPPVPLMVKLLALILPVSVAVPAVLVTDTLPVVVIAAIF